MRLWKEQYKYGEEGFHCNPIVGLSLFSPQIILGKGNLQGIGNVIKHFFRISEATKRRRYA